MTTVLRFSRQNDAGLRALNFVLWENLVLVVVLVLESKSSSNGTDSASKMTLKSNENNLDNFDNGDKSLFGSKNESSSGEIICSSVP